MIPVHTKGDVFLQPSKTREGMVEATDELKDGSAGIAEDPVDALKVLEIIRASGYRGVRLSWVEIKDE